MQLPLAATLPLESFHPTILYTANMREVISINGEWLGPPGRVPNAVPSFGLVFSKYTDPIYYSRPGWLPDRQLLLGGKFVNKAIPTLAFFVD